MADYRKRLILAKIEGTYGVSSAPNGTNALLVSELDISPLEIDLQDRELITPYFGNTEKVAAQTMVTASFSVELAGSGAAGTAPQYGDCLRACAFSETVSAGVSVTYAPISAAIESVTINCNYDGVQHLIVGCRGTFSLELNVGQIPKINFEFTGLYATPTATAAATPTYADQAAPVAVNSANTTGISVHGYAGCLESLTLNLANEVTYRQLAGCSRQVRITDRKPEGEFTIEAVSVASKDYWSAIKDQTLGEMVFQHGQTAGNIVTFDAPTVNLGSPSYGDSDGVLMLSAPFMPNPDAGNDEFTLVYT